MSELVENQVGALEQVLIGGDLSRLSPQDRILYYKSICSSLGLNPLTKPFDYITLNGKMTLYAKRDCTDQLRKINGISIIITSRAVDKDCYVVTARATDKSGRTDESTGVVPIENLKGEARSNAMMKAETKAKRRVTLSICGLGFLDETEVPEVSNYSDAQVTIGREPEMISAKISEVKYLLKKGNTENAYAICESLIDPNHKAELWYRLNPDERNLLKDVRENVKGYNHENEYLESEIS
jgi:hypothetical protein